MSEERNNQEAPQVGPKPCPKCGCEDTSMRYEPFAHYHCGGHGEHFDRQCSRCSCQWTTQDVLPRAVSGG